MFARPRHPPAQQEGSSIEKEPRINEQIRVPEVRLIGEDGEQLGVRPLAEALRLSRDLALDLVEVAPNAAPPVCRIMDYGKFKYQAALKAKEARKRQSHIVIKEMKMRPKIDIHDYGTKSRHVERFLREGSKVKATIMFRGREMAHAELGRRILDRLADDMAEVAYVETAPNQDGRNMIMVLAPHKAVVEALREGAAAEADNVAADNEAPAQAQATEAPADAAAQDTEISQEASASDDDAEAASEATS